MRRASLIAVVLGLGLALLLSLETSSETGDQPECTVTLSPGQSIQEAIARAEEGAVICLAAGEWKENVVIEKGLTLRAAEVQLQPEVVIQSAKEDWPVILIRSDEPIEVVLQGLKVTGAFGECYQYEPERICADGISVYGRAQATIQGNTISDNIDGILMLDSSQATIENNTISDNMDGILMWGSSQATIENNTISDSTFGILMLDSAQATIENNPISDNGTGILMEGSAQATIENNPISGNRTGILMWGSAQATIENNKIVYNWRYGVACYQRPCLDIDWKFEGAVRGSKNEISGNRKADVCPAALEFLKTSAGGCYGPGC